MDFQVAQKIHACTDPHSEERRNDRVHDVIDLLLVKDAFFTGADDPQLRRACEAIFEARAREAHATDQPVRGWPPQLEPHPHWAPTYPALADEVGLPLTFDEAIAAVNDWISKIAWA